MPTVTLAMADGRKHTCPQCGEVSNANKKMSVWSIWYAPRYVSDGNEMPVNIEDIQCTEYGIVSKRRKYPQINEGEMY